MVDFCRGWDVFNSSSVARGALSWLTELPLPLPFLAEDYSITCSPLAMVIIGVCTLVLCKGAKESSRFNNAMTILN